MFLMPKMPPTIEEVQSEALRRFESWVNCPTFNNEKQWSSFWLMDTPFWKPNEINISQEVGLNVYLRRGYHLFSAPEGERRITTLDIGNFIAADADFGRQFLQQFVQEAHQRHPWDATFVDDDNVVSMMGDLSQWAVNSLPGYLVANPVNFYYLLK